MKKRILSVFLVLALMLALLPAQAVAAWTGNGDADEAAATRDPRAGAAESPGVATIATADEVTYQLEPDVEGGATLTFDKATGAVKKYNRNSSTATQVTIPDTIEEVKVTAIEYSAFSYQKDLTRVTIPESVTVIGERAFEQCSALDLESLPESVTEIKSFAFYGCTALSSITRLPDSLTSLGEGAFSKTGLTEITIPGGVKDTGWKAFMDCEQLATVTMEEGVQSVGTQSFRGCDNLTTVKFADTVKTVSEEAFAYCYILTGVTLPAGLTSLGKNAFASTALTEITIPGGVKTIKASAFDNCHELVSVTLNEGVELLEDGVFSSCDAITTVNFPESLQNIGRNAFASCKALSSVKLPETNLQNIDYNAFGGSGLTEITVPASVTNIGARAFCYCASLTTATINANVTALPSRLFMNCRNLSQVTLPDGLTSIGSYAFGPDANGCDSLTHIDLPDTVQSIGEYAFRRSGLNSIKLPSSLTQIGQSAFASCDSLTEVDFSAATELTAIASGAFQSCPSLRTLDIPSHIKTIGTIAFSGCLNLTSVTLHDGLETIGQQAFSTCYALSEVTIPGTVKTVDIYAFSGDGLKTVTLEEGVGNVGKEAFANCHSLEKVYVYGAETTFDADVFKSSNVENLTIYGHNGSPAQTYAIQNDIRFVSLDQGRTLSVTVKLPDGTVQSDGFTATWTDGSGETYTGSQVTVTGDKLGETFTLRVELGDELAALYEAPAAVTVGPEDPDTVEIQLVERVKSTLSGRVTDEDGNPLTGVAVTADYDAGTVEGVTGEDGGFSLSVPQGDILLTLKMEGFYTQKKVVSLTADTALDDIVLKKALSTSDRIALTVTQSAAVKAGGEAKESILTSLDALSVTLTKGGAPFTDFEVQGTVVLLKPGTVNASDQITVTVSDPAGRYVAASAAVTLDEDRAGVAELTLTEKGSFTLGELSGPAASLLIFDEAGNSIYTGEALSGVSSVPLDAGTYTVVLLEATDLLRGVPTLNDLSNLDLTAGTDYLSLPVTVADGVIEDLGAQTVPRLDPDLLSYVVADRTSAAVNDKPGGMTQGEMFVVRATYELDASKDVTAGTLRVVLPEGIDLVTDTTALVNGAQKGFTWDAGSRTVSIDMGGADTASVYLCCRATSEVGQFPISVSLTLSNGVVQPIGTAVAIVNSVSIVAPKVTAISKVPLSGVAAPRSTVTVYDGDTVIGTTEANAAGSWYLEAELAEKLYTFSFHMLRAESTSESGTWSTEETVVTYDVTAPLLTTITMYNWARGQVETVFDFTGNSMNNRVPHFSYSSAYPQFTFKAEFDQTHTQPEEVYIVTVSSLGDKTYVEMTYDESLKAWVGTAEYTSSQVPVQIYAVFNDGEGLPEELPFDEEWEADFREEMSEAFDIVVEEMTPIVEDYLSFDPDNQAIVDDEGELFANVKAEEFVDDSVTAEYLEENGYSNVEGNYWIKQEPNDENHGVFTMSVADVSKHRIITYSLDFGEEQEISAFSTIDAPMMIALLDSGFDDSTWLADAASALNNILSFTFGIEGAEAFVGASSNVLAKFGSKVSGYASVVATAIQALGRMHNLSSRLNGSCAVLENEVDSLKALVNLRCDDGSYVLTDANRQYAIIKLQEISEKITAYRKTSGIIAAVLAVGGTALALASSIGGLMIGTLAGTASAGVVGAVVGSAAGVIVGNYLAGLLLESFVSEAEKELDRGYSEVASEINGLRAYINSHMQPCDQDPMPMNPTEQSPAKAVRPIMDPSGYVYEAVPSNRLEGVTATIYYKDASEAEALWDAADYDQINPQVTGAGGDYNWDVPEGQWLVKFTKDGYEDADTSKVSAAVDGWLPVPPPQMNIHVGMVSKAAPQVSAATAYTDGVLVTFSQYMDIESVLSSFTVTAGGEPVSVTVTAVDAEEAFDGTEYATRFALVPAGGSTLTGEVTVAVAGSAANYAGKTLGTAYASPAMTPRVRPTGINAPERISIGTHEEVNVPVWLLAGDEGAANVALTVESLTPALVEIVTASVTTNANGEATVKLRGLLPGEGLIRITDPVSGLGVTVTVDTTQSAAAPVIAKRADGTEVHDGDTLPAGTTITLTSADPDAVIRYTLDGTCPCKSEALVYNGEAIAITKDTVLRAAAVRDGVYSATVRLELHASTAPAPGPSQSGGTPSADPEPEPEPDITDPHVNGVAGLLEADSHIAFMHGDSGLFRPDGSLTRAEAAQIFYNLLKNKNVTGNASFPDVDPQTWYAPAVLALANLGILDGCEDGNYQPDRTITRAEFVTIAARFTDCEEAGAVTFPDVSAAHWAWKYIGLAAYLGWINGTDGGRFEPDRDISRAEAAKVVNRMLGRKPDAGYIAAHAADLLRFPDITDKHWAWAEIMEAVNAHGHTAKDGEETWTGLQ